MPYPVGVSVYCLPPFRYSLNALGHLWLNKQEMNRIIRDDIFMQYVQVTWLELLVGFEAQDGVLCRPLYGAQRCPHCSTPLTLQHWMHVLRIPLCHFQVGLHRSQVEADHQILQDVICQQCHLQETETEALFVFRCPIYYEIRGRFFCLFRES